MHTVTNPTLQVTAAHPLMGLQMPNHWFEAIKPVDGLALRFTKTLGLVAMDDYQVRVVTIYTSVGQIDDRHGWFPARLLSRDRVA